MVREHPLRALDFSGKTFRDYAPGSAESRNRQILHQLGNPPEDFDARQSLLDAVPSYFLKYNGDLFVPLKRYIRDVLGREIPDENLAQATQLLKEHKVVPVLTATIWDYDHGKSQRIVFRVLVWDYERGLAERKVS